MVRPFAIEFGGWASKRLLPRRGHPGRIPMSSASSARSAAKCLDHIIILNEHHLRGVLSQYFQYHHATRTHLSLDKDCPQPRRIQLPPQARLLRSRKSVVCIIATNVAPPELLWRPNRRTRFGVRPFRLLHLYCSDARTPEPMHGAQVAAAPHVLFDQSKIVSRDLHRQTDSQTGQVFVQDRFLSRDRQRSEVLSRYRTVSRRLPVTLHAAFSICQRSNV